MLHLPSGIVTDWLMALWLEGIDLLHLEIEQNGETATCWICRQN
jgi:hypothetical protein